MQELLDDGDKQFDKKECIPECVIERDKEEGATLEVAGIDESLEIEPDFIQVNKFIIMANYMEYLGKSIILKFFEIYLIF